MIAIINYGMGNLRSVFNAFSLLGADASVVEKPQELRKADRIVLPGVGAFSDGMANLITMGWKDELNSQVLDKSKPFLGLCLGLQLLAAAGTEGDYVDGLGWLPGTVRRLDDKKADIRIPHIGWNDVAVIRNNGMYRNLGDRATFYFLHSYVLYPDNPEYISGICNYGSDFTASIEHNNIWATQFHPEKSQKAGLTLLKNFLAL